MPDLETIATRLAGVLGGSSRELADPTGSELTFEDEPVLRPLIRTGSPDLVYAIDGGQALLADARCLQVVATRAARVAYSPSGGELEDQGPVNAYLLGIGQDRASLADLEAPVHPGTAVDINLLRDWAEWRLVEATVAESSPGTMILVDGDLQPDWRIPSSWLGQLFMSALERGVDLVGVTKHSSLSRGGLPLLAALEADAREVLGTRSCWWSKVAATRGDLTPGIDVYVTSMDPDARFSFRVDLVGGSNPEPVLGALSSLCDDAAFPGYPYPLSAADGLAALSGYQRAELWDLVQRQLSLQGVDPEEVERAFTDRHRLMERA